MALMGAASFPVNLSPSKPCRAFWRCCGACSSYLLQQPVQGNRLDTSQLRRMHLLLFTSDKRGKVTTQTSVPVSRCIIHLSSYTRITRAWGKEAPSRCLAHAFQSNSSLGHIFLADIYMSQICKEKRFNRTPNTLVFFLCHIKKAVSVLFTGFLQPAQETKNETPAVTL